MEFDPRRFNAALQRFDQANAQDPNRVPYEGGEIASELHYGRRMSQWQEKLYPAASEPLRLAARAQHIPRWEIPRDRYPRDRAGYHRWRTTLYTFHADTAAAILRELDYDEPTIARVRFLLRKERLKADADTQALEDIICLVFLENYFADFAPKHDEEKVVVILRRTWAKMSPVGHAAALQLQMPPAAAAPETAEASGFGLMPSLQGYETQIRSYCRQGMIDPYTCRNTLATLHSMQ